MQEFTTFACPVPRNARDCADYYSVIEHPMDLGTMESAWFVLGKAVLMSA